jgi:acyl carrier protein
VPHHTARHETPASSSQAVVREVISELAPAGTTHLTSDSQLVADLGFDSLGLVELIVVLEDTLGGPPFDERALAAIATVGDLERVAQEAQGERP